MLLRRSLSALALLASIAAPRVAAAHPVTVDGNASEWFTRVPNADNLGLVARDAAKAGEYIWRDVANDARTDIANPETIAEITGVQITGTTSGFGVLVRNVPGGVALGKPIQVQLAIDLDRTAGSGMDFMAGFADTKVHDAARWEFLVQTLFGSGGQAQVINTSFTTVAPAQAAQGPNGVEIFVPWSAIGLAGPPSSPLRFSLATFRAEANDLTTDIGGPSVSNVIDAVTDYGDPRTTGYPNTFVDVQDQTLDYFFDVFFDAKGEVYAPLVVQSFVAAASGSEWITVKNVSPITLPLDVFKLGDEETPDQGEGMRRFPTGATLAAGARYTVAVSAAQYQTTFGVPPDAEQGATVVAVPKVTAFAAWAGGLINLANAGDEILVLDGSNTILDIAVYGSGAYAGVTSKTPAPASDVVLTRDATSSDTDDCQVDFTALGQCANDAACGSVCKACLGNACTPKPVGTSCADATVCNGAELCDAAGACVNGTAPNCDDNNLCTNDSCDAVLGCQHTPVAAGTSCSDGNVCNGTETCNGSGACITTAPGSCDDNNPCTADSCDAVGGCMHTNLPAGTSCDADGDPCNGVATCSAAGVCTTGPAPSCDDGNPCTADTCMTGTGCVSSPLAAGSPCSDGNQCNGVESCNGAGTCMPGTPLDCNDGNPCTSDSCNPATGCAHANAPMGTSCKDADACNGDETCNGTGSCVAGTPLDCNDGNPCTTDTCSPATGCAHAPLPMGTSCKDADVCNGDETCNGTGSCVAGTPLVCDDGNACTSDGCDPALGCTTTPLAAGTACSSDPNCTGQTCDGSGVCGGGNCGTGGTGGTGTGGTGTGGTGTGGSATGGTGTGGASTGGTGTTTTSNTTTSDTTTTSLGETASSSSGGLGDEGTCGCRVAGGADGERGRAAWIAIGLAALLARRRRS